MTITISCLLNMPKIKIVFFRLLTNCSTVRRTLHYLQVNQTFLLLMIFQLSINEIENILDTFSVNMNSDTLYTSGNGLIPKQQLTRLEPATEEEIHEILSKSPSKSCELDSIPTVLLKKYFYAIVPTLIRIINSSLDTGIVPDSFKVAHVRLLLKKPSLDKNVFKNYGQTSLKLD